MKIALISLVLLAIVIGLIYWVGVEITGVLDKYESEDDESPFNLN